MMQMTQVFADFFILKGLILQGFSNPWRIFIE